MGKRPISKKESEAKKEHQRKLRAKHVRRWRRRKWPEFNGFRFPPAIVAYMSDAVRHEIGLDFLMEGHNLWTLYEMLDKTKFRRYREILAKLIKHARCCNCEEWKPEDHFYIRSDTNQLSSVCKECTG